jgi:oligoribonuclease
MDLEMTGLDPGRDVIVEMATVITDDYLNIVAEGPDLVVGATAEQLGAMEDVVQRMHTSSGLLEAIADSSVTVADAVEATLEFVRLHVPRAGEVPLCGNSIGVDRRFLRRYGPDLDAYFHYRSIDVSTLKELCKRWAPEVYARRPPKLTAHRALDDVHESIAELKYYKENFLSLAAAAVGAEPAGGPAPSAAS